MNIAADRILSEMGTLTLGGLARRAAVAFGERPFLIDEAGATSFADIYEAANRCATGLRAAGIGAGSKVAVWLPNDRNWVILFIAIGKVGAMMVPINTRYKPDEVSYVLERSEAQALVLLRSKWGIDYVELLREVVPDIANLAHGRPSDGPFPALRNVFLISDEPEPGMIPFHELMEEKSGTPPPPPQTSDLLLICFTSGSTGKPKGVMHAHSVIVQSVRVGLAMRMGPDTPILGHMPFYHSAGLFMALIPALALGSPLVLMEEWKADRAIELIARHQVARIGGIPTHFYDLIEAQLRHPRELGSLEAAWIGGSAIMPSSFANIMSVLGLGRLLSTYGMTENTISTTFNRWDDPVERCAANSAPKLSECEVKIVDPTTFAALPDGSEGELWCRGRTVMRGYYRDEEATAAVLTADGWLRTGDMAIYDAEGYISITGRLKEILKVGGVNVSPIEVEQVLASHPSVRAVAVVPLPHERLTEVPLAFVEIHDGKSAEVEDLVAHCRTRMALYKVPREIRFVTSLPRTETGKIKRAELAKQVAAEEAESAAEAQIRSRAPPEAGRN